MGPPVLLSTHTCNHKSTVLPSPAGDSGRHNTAAEMVRQHGSPRAMDGCQCTHTHAHTHTLTPILVPRLTTFVELDVRQLLYSTQSNCVMHGNDIHICAMLSGDINSDWA